MRLEGTAGEGGVAGSLASFPRPMGVAFAVIMNVMTDAEWLESR